MKKITNQDLIDVLLKFDSELEFDDEKIAEMSDKEKSELYLAVKKVLSYREDFPPDLADAVQTLAKKAVEKQGIQKSDASSFDLNPDEDGIVCDDGSIIEPGDELFPLAKKVSKMSGQQIEQFVDDLATVVRNCGQAMIAKLEKKLQVAKDRSSDDKGEGNWPSISERD